MTGVLVGYEDATRRRAPLPPVRRDERGLDRRVEPRGGPLTTPAAVGQGRCHPPGRGPRWCPLAVRGPRSGGATDPEHRRRRRSGRRPARRADPRARAAGLPEGRLSIAAFGDEVDRWGATFDRRLPVCTVDAGNGRRVAFGGRSAPPASVGQAVAASCAIPAVFTPVRIGDRLYVDGGAWSPTNADAAPARTWRSRAAARADRRPRPRRAAGSGPARGRRAPEPWRRGEDCDSARLGPPSDGAPHGPRRRRAHPGGGLSARRC